MLKAAAHYACIYKLARTVVHLALTHIDNTLAQGVRGFFQLFDFAGQLRLGLKILPQAGFRKIVKPMNYYQTDNYAAQSLDAKVSAVMKSVYVKMFLGLLVTAAVAWGVAATATPGSGFLYYLATHSWLYWALAIVEVGLVLWISAGLRKMSAGMATGLFFLFAVVNGLTLSLIFVVYSLPAIFKTFLITAGVFGAMSVYGYFTNRDLTKIGTYLYMALFGLIILMVVNIFWANSTRRSFYY